MAGATRAIEIDAPIEKCFEVITKYEDYPKFLSDMKAVTVTARNNGNVEASFTLKVVMEVQYKLRLTEKAPNEVSWVLAEGKMFKQNDGGWKLEALGPNKTRAEYRVEVDIRGFVPKSVATGLVETTLPKTLQAFKERCEE